MQRLKVKNLAFTITKYYTDANGDIIDKNTLPASFQIKLPFYLFGQFDRQSHFATSRKVVPTIAPWIFYNFYVSNSYDFLLITGANGIRSRIGTSDLVFAYTDNVTNPTYFCWVVISGTTQNIASIFDDCDNSLKAQHLLLDYTGNTSNFVEDIFFIVQDKMSDYKTQSFTPEQFVRPQQDNPNQSLIGLTFRNSKYLSLASYIEFESDLLSWTIPFQAERFDEDVILGVANTYQ